MMRISAILLLLLSVGCGGGPEYDLIIAGGRVMDPESGLDAIRNVGVLDGRIAAITEDSLLGRKTIDAAGLVVAPGFVDLHEHGQSPENYRAQIRDGVTTALELEIGVEDVADWYAEREGGAAVNFGASISHPYSRQAAVLGRSQGLSGEGMDRPLDSDQKEALEQRIRKGLEEGAAAVGFGIAYTPGATLDELVGAFEIAAEYGAVCHVHMRTGYDLSNLEEVLNAAKQSGASLHIVHLNSSAQDEAARYLLRIAEAQREGIDVTTECYPYNRGSTMIEAALFNDWESYPDEEFSQYIYVETGETLTRETFGKYRAVGGTLITPPSYSEETVWMLVAHPLTMIASDGMWIDNGRAHPRSFGTYSRVLGRSVREQGAMGLMDALAKMTLRPAQRLEKRVPAMKMKGRVAVGADADLAVFDPKTILDRGTFSDPAQAPVGMRHVVVNGTVTLEDGEIVEDAAAGRAIRAGG